MTVSVVVALVASLVLGPLVLSWLQQRRILDLPSVRSSHAVPTPRGGGLALMLASLVGVLTGEALGGHGGIALVVGSVAFGVLGLAEDIVGVPTVRRLAGQVTIAVALLPLLLPRLDVPLQWRLLVAAIVVFWLVAFVNAFNFMDGINGISVAQVAATALLWWLSAAATGRTGLGEAAAVVGAASLGFLPLNFPRARLFLGDAGSYFLGAWLAIVVVVGIRSGMAVEAMLAPLALYLGDTGLTLLRRVQHGARLGEPHREHAYQQLVQLGWSHAGVTGLVFAVTAACSVLGMVSQVGMVGLRVPADVAIVALVCGYLRLPRWVRAHRAVVAAW